MSNTPRIVVAGAGVIGCYVGGRLVGKHDVHFLGRPRIANDIEQHGLVLSDYEGARVVLTPEVHADPAILQGADIVLVAVKSAATQGIAATIAKFAPKATVISLQNGIRNADILRQELPDADVRAAVVPFNVIQMAPGHFHKASSGNIILEDSGELCRVLDADTFDPSADIRSVQWGKLLINLNNALNALSGMTLLDQLHNRDWRRILAMQISEAIKVLKTAGISPARFTPLPPALIPYVLQLPTPMFRRVAKAMLTIDPTARSSMQDDLRLGRKTEIDALQGEVLTLAASHHISCPTIKAVCQAIARAEGQKSGPQNWTRNVFFL